MGPEDVVGGLLAKGPDFDTLKVSRGKVEVLIHAIRKEKHLSLGPELPEHLNERFGLGSFELERIHQDHPISLGPGIERRSPSQSADLSRDALSPRMRDRRERDSAPDHLHGANGSLASPPGPLLLEWLAATTLDLSPGLGRSGTLPLIRQVSLDHLV